jgi:hypothetical protein
MEYTWVDTTIWLDPAFRKLTVKEKLDVLKAEVLGLDETTFHHFFQRNDGGVDVPDDRYQDVDRPEGEGAVDRGKGSVPILDREQPLSHERDIHTPEGSD